jgi:hypothetical protein
MSKPLYDYLGTCVEILDNGCPFADDATELAQFVEKGQKITREDFLAIIGEEYYPEMMYPFHYFYYQDVAWTYDYELDIHYFYKEKN